MLIWKVLFVHLYDFFPGGTYENIFFCTIVSRNNFLSQQGIILATFRKDCISDTLLGNQPLSSRTCMWIREMGRAWHGVSICLSKWFMCLHCWVAMFVPACTECHSLCMPHVLGRMSACVCLHACINSLQSGWLWSQTALSGCIATTSSLLPYTTPPPTPFFACECLNLQRNLKSFSMLSHLLYLRPQCVCRCVCVRVCICYLWIPQRQTYERGKERKMPPDPPAVSLTERHREVETSLHVSFTLRLIILMFLLWISMRALKSLLPPPSHSILWPT